jgi:hypothetical protein
MSDFDFHHNLGAQFGDGNSMYLNIPPDKRAWLDKMVNATPTELRALAKQADLLGESGQIAEARELFSDLRLIHWRRGPGDRAGCLKALEGAAFWAQEHGDVRRARDLYDQALAEYTASYGRADDRTLAVLANTAHASGCVGDAHAAYTLYCELLEHHQRTKGLIHPETLEAFKMKAWWTGCIMGNEQARDRIAVLVENLTQYGPHHPAVVWAQNLLAEWRERVKYERKYIKPDIRWSAWTQKQWKEGII